MTAKSHHSERRYLLVAARAYSGSTLLSALLAAHPLIATVGEVSGSRREHRMDTFGCSCGRRMVDCPFWHAVAAGMRERGYDDFRLANFELNFSPAGGALERVRTGSLRWTFLEELRDRAFALVPGRTASLHRLGRRNEAFAETVLEHTGARVFVDTSKERMRARYLRLFMPMDLRVVHLVRDVRGVVDSMARHAGEVIDLEAAARNWSRTNGTIMRHVAQLPADRQLLVRYEELCADPIRVVAAIHDFCGLPRLGSGDERASRSQHLLGNQRRLEPGWTRIALDERWRSRFTAHELARIARAAGATAARLYPEAASESAP